MAKHLLLFVSLALCAFGLAAAADIALPVGVAPSEAGFYQIGKVFQCKDGSLKIAYSQVNDDYCDCPDGSDEPGTSACSPLGRFYCRNKGYRGEFIPSSQVNDGICDCCDGSDEQANICGNSCIEKGRHLQEERRTEIEKHLKGSERKDQYQAEAKQQLVEKEADKQTLSARLGELDSKIKALEDKQNELKEDKELADRIYKIENANTSENKEGEEEEEVAEDSDLENDDDTKSEEDWEREEGEEDYISEVNEEEGERKEEGDGTTAEVVQQEEEVVDVAELKAKLEERGKVVSEVIKEYDQLEQELKGLRDERRNVNRQLDDIDALLKKDFGPSGEFYYLLDKCVEWKSVEYTYKICPYKDARQDHTELGRWEGWEDNYTTMKFTNGLKCWGGPARSLTIKAICGSEDVLRDVEEPSRCSYSAVFETPALCSKEHAIALQLSFGEDFDIEEIPFV